MKTRFAALAVLMITGNLLGYPQSVHRVITEKAFDQAQAGIQPHLGLTAGQLQMAKLWMSNGANDEDNGLRSLDHFFDPAYSPHFLAGLSVQPVCDFPAGLPADIYATESGGFAPFFAMEQYEQAIIGPNPGTRAAHLQELFSDLGHQVHLIEDMAQPEHTRNDQHLFAFGATAASLYEEWGAENLINNPGLGKPVVSYDGYPNVHLADYADYFHNSTGSGLAEFSNRGFFTQDTNIEDERSIGQCRYYSTPDLDLTGAAERVVFVNEEYRDAFGGPHTEVVQESIWTSFPMDNLLPEQETDVFHNFRSIIDFETRIKLNCPPGTPAGRCGVFSLGEPSYLSRASMLIPRAVGYSAGYLDHFFRGKLAAEWKPTVADPTKFLLKLTNASSERIDDRAQIEAFFKADAEYLGRTSSDDLAPILPLQHIFEAAPDFAGLDPGQTVNIGPITIPDLHPHDNINDFERRIVVRGKLGNENDAVIGLVQGGKVLPELRIEVSWVGHGLISEPLVGIGSNPLAGSIVGGFSFFTPFCNTVDGVEWCFATPPARDLAGSTAVLTVSKVRTGTTYYVFFCNTAGGNMDVTVTVFANGHLKKTTTKNVDMTFTGFCPQPIAVYP